MFRGEIVISANEARKKKSNMNNCATKESSEIM